MPHKHKRKQRDESGYLLPRNTIPSFAHQLTPSITDLTFLPSRLLAHSQLARSKPPPDRAFSRRGGNTTTIAKMILRRPSSGSCGSRSTASTSTVWMREHRSPGRRESKAKRNQPTKSQQILLLRFRPYYQTKSYPTLLQELIGRFP